MIVTSATEIFGEGYKSYFSEKAVEVNINFSKNS